MTTKSKPSLTIKSSLCLKTPAGSQGLDAKWTFCGQTWFWFCCQSEGFCYCFAKPVGVIFPLMSSQFYVFGQPWLQIVVLGRKGKIKTGSISFRGATPWEGNYAVLKLKRTWILYPPTLATLQCFFTSVPTTSTTTVQMLNCFWKTSHLFCWSTLKCLFD